MTTPILRNQQGRILDVSEPVVFLSLAATNPAARRTTRGTTITSPDAELSERIVQLKAIGTSKRMSQVEITFWNEDLALTESPIMRHGTILKVAWGYSGHLSRKRSFKVTKIKGSRAMVRFMGRVTIVATSLEVDMHGKKKSRVFRNMTEGGMIRQIAREYGIPAANQIIGPDDGVKTNIHQSNKTDAEQLAALADTKGWVFSYEGGVLTVAPHSMVHQNQPVARYTYYTDEIGWLRRIDPEDNTLSVPGAVKVKSTDPRTGKPVSHTATISNRNTPSMGRYTPLKASSTTNTTGKRVHRSTSMGKPEVVEVIEEVYLPNANAKQVKKEAKRRQENAQARVHKARLVMIGDPILWKDSRIHIDGVSPALSGMWRIVDCTHTLGNGGYFIEAKLRRDAVNSLGKGEKPKKEQTAKSVVVSNRTASRTSKRVVVADVQHVGVVKRARFSDG